MEVTTSNKIEGRIKRITLEKENGETRELPGFNNSILGNTLIHPNGGSPAELEATYLYFGTGTGATDPNMLGLESPGNISGLPTIGSDTVTSFDFVNREAVGVSLITYRSSTPGFWEGTWTELGFGARGKVYSRALIRDGNDNPTSVTVLSDEYITVEYEVTIRRKVNELTGTALIGGNSYNYKLIGPPAVHRDTYLTYNSRDRKINLNIMYDFYDQNRYGGQLHRGTLCNFKFKPTNMSAYEYLDELFSGTSDRAGNDVYNNSYEFQRFTEVTRVTNAVTATGPKSAKSVATFPPGNERVFDFIGFSHTNSGGSNSVCIIVFNEPVVLPSNEELTVELNISWDF